MISLLINFLRKPYCLLFSIFFLITSLNAQNVFVSGKIFDKSSDVPLPGAAVMLINVFDTNKYFGNVTQADGSFKVSVPISAKYKLKVTYLSYKSYVQEINVKKSNISLPLIKLEEDFLLLKDVAIESTQIRVVQKEDTLEFNSAAYKTNPDATAEDLVKKMPGVTTDGSTIKVHGEEVKKVLVDGKEFFGDDPNATLKNLPADMIDKVQVFDKQSEQAQFTGFSDGDEQKSINIVTKANRNIGQFGNVYAGYGTNDRYNAGFIVNHFDGGKRISLIGMSNNINQQNFNISDIMSLVSNSGSVGSRGGRFRGGADFWSGNQRGNTITNAIGLNYVDDWGKKISVTASYFFNNTNNTDSSSSIRNYFSDDKLIYLENNKATSNNTNHRANLKLEYKIDSSNTIIVSPRLTIQNFNRKSLLRNSNQLPTDTSLLSNTLTNNNSENTALNFQNYLLYMHKFAKKGRTLSLNINTQFNQRDGEGNYLSLANYFNDSTNYFENRNQKYITESEGTNLRANISYTEPIGEKAQLQISYRPSQNINNSDKETFSYDNAVFVFDTTLSNVYENIFTTQRTGIDYRYNDSKLNLSAGVDFQNYNLKGEQTFPYTSSVSKSYNNLLPNARLSYKFSKTKNLYIRYRSSIDAPSISQLQNVIDVSNPLLVKTGNMELLPSYENMLMMRMGFTNPDKARSLFVFVRATHSNNYITNTTYLLKNDTLIQGYNINKGSQLSKPVNLDNYYNIRSFGVYSLPVKKIKSNLSFNFGYMYSHNPALINNNVNYSNNNSVNSGIAIASNISENIDFSLSYDGNFNTVRNTINKQSNSEYYNHKVSAKANFIIKKKFVINTDVNQITYSGLSDSYNQNYILWNAYLGYKLLKDNSLEARISVYDILNQNTSVSRNITESYTEDSYTQILKRYALFTLTYTIKNFKNGKASVDENTDAPRGMFMRPPGH